MSLFQALYLYLINPVMGLLMWVVIVRVVMSWLIAYNVINLHNQFVAMVWQICGKIYEPMVQPIRKMIPNFGGMDFSPFILILLLQFTNEYLLRSLVFGTLRIF